MAAANDLRLSGVSAADSARLVGRLCDESVGADELALRIERDPALCARVLKVANSAFYAQQRTVTTVRRALLVLGLNAVRGIAAAACIDQMVPRRIVALPDGPSLLRHTLAAALASEMLASACSPALASQAFVTALLHNVGVVIQAGVDPAGIAAIVAARNTNSLTEIRALESEHARIGHEAAAAAVFEEWKLPPSLIAAVQNHHAPADAPEEHRELATLVSCGAQLALTSGMTYSLERVGTDLAASGAVAELLDRCGQAFSEFRDELIRRLLHLEEALL